MLSRKNKVNKGFFEKKTLFEYQLSGEVSNLKVSKIDSTAPLFGFIVSKKVSPKAVDRNLIKRRFSGIIERNLDKIPNNKAFLFFIKKETLSYRFSDLETEVLKLINQVK